MELIAAGGGGVSVLAQQAGAALKIFDLAIGQPTPDCVLQDAMSERDCVATMAFGMEVLAQGHDCLILSHLSSGGEAIAATLALSLYGGEPQDWLPVRDIAGGPADTISTKEMTQAIGAAAKRATVKGHDPLALLCAVGGREIAAIAGAILAARLQSIPVILDGYPACVAGAVLQSVNPEALDHCLMAQWDGSPAHARILEKLGHKALLGLSIFDGAGAAGALALQVVKAALACHTGMATYEQAGLTGPN
jgi:nicotinate-nucleotide--dimethylbenzimidazole phosphoribosyltransferase